MGAKDQHTADTVDPTTAAASTTDSASATGDNTSDAAEWEVITRDERDEAAAYDRDYGHRIEVGDKYYQRNCYAGRHEPGCNCGSSAEAGKK